MEPTSTDDAVRRVVTVPTPGGLHRIVWANSRPLRDFPARPDDADNALLGTAPESGSTAAPRNPRNSAMGARRTAPPAGRRVMD